MIESTIYVGDLRARVGSRRNVRVEIPGSSFSSSLCKIIDEITCDLILESVNHGIVVHGSLQMNYSAQCSFGLIDIVEPLTVNINELFEELRPREKIDDDDEQTYTFKGDDINIEQMLRDSILTSLPLAPVCGHGPENCTICASQVKPFLAKDLDRISKDIVGGIDDVTAERTSDNRWSALNDLKLDE